MLRIIQACWKGRGQPCRAQWPLNSSVERAAQHLRNTEGALPVAEFRT